MRDARRHAPLFAALLMAAGALAFAQGSPAAKRPFRLDDIFELEDVGRYYGGPWAFAPDGRALAFTRVRAKKTLTNHKWEYLWGNAGADVWLQRAPGEAPSNLTNGISDGSGWWAPQWSPDGRRLAMLSTRGGNVGLWVLEPGRGEPRLLTKRGVDITRVREQPFLWVDDARILCPVLPEGEQPMSMRVELTTPQVATREWAKTPAGKESTASVLESGVPVDLAKRPQGRLLSIDAATGESTVIVERNTAAWQLAPKGGRVAYAVQTGVYTPRANEPLRLATSGTYTVEIRSLAGQPVRLDAKLPEDVFQDSLRWSPDGRELAFFAFTQGRSKTPDLYRVDVEAGRVAHTELGAIDAEPAVRLETQLEWTAAGDLLFLAATRDKAEKPSPTARRDWYVAPRGGAKPRNLSAGMEAPPAELWPQPGLQSFVGVGGSRIWRVRPGDGKLEALTEKPAEGRTVQIAWPVQSNSGQDEYARPGRVYPRIVTVEREGARGEHADYAVLDVATGRRSALAKPADEAALMMLGPGDSAIFTASGKEGTFAWREAVGGGGGGGGKADALVSANTFLRDVVEGALEPIEYTSLNGEKLKGWILLPIGYEKGKRYPTIAWVYAGSVFRGQKPYLAEAAHGLSLNMQIPASRGYAVLFPSMPMKEEGELDDPMLRLPEGVMPAIDRVIELGYADPDRLFVMGQSFGGFSTYGLVTQTNRFKGAVALAGLCDFISLYSQFDARLRYDDFPHENLFMAALMESAQTAMGNPPWKDFGRYTRNSPIFYVDRVETPVMIVQGDLDYVAIQQGEEFFNSLYRQGKRAEFVRYWGEGHVLESPANIRDMWQRIEAWLDTTGNLARAGDGSFAFEGERVRQREEKKTPAAAAPVKP